MAQATCSQINRIVVVLITHLLNASIFFTCVSFCLGYGCCANEELLLDQYPFYHFSDC